MDGGTRRETLSGALKQSGQSDQCQQTGRIARVSRQIIVGDIALLRAAGEAIRLAGSRLSSASAVG